MKEKQAYAKAKAIKGSVQKVALVGSMIKGLKAFDALLQLQFSTKRAAKDLRAVLFSAVSNAENNNGMDVDNLVVDRVVVGRAFTLKRFMARGRGRSAGIKKPFSNVTIYLRENTGK